MRIGGLVWFIVGFVTCMLFTNDLLGSVLGGAVTAIGRIVTFFLELGTAGVGGVLALIAVALLLGREWSERARGKFEADRAWNNRNAHRREG